MFSVKSQFMKAYYRLTFMISKYFELDELYQTRKTNIKPPRINTVLGAVICINKTVLEHRDYVEDCWKQICAGKVDPYVGNLGKSLEDDRKRKRPENHRFEVVNNSFQLVEDDSGDYFEEFTEDDDDVMLGKVSKKIKWDNCMEEDDSSDDDLRKLMRKKS